MELLRWVKGTKEPLLGNEAGRERLRRRKCDENFPNEMPCNKTSARKRAHLPQMTKPRICLV